MLINDIFVMGGMSVLNKQKSIGFNIKRIREIKGMKQFHLAELIGVTQQTLSEFENCSHLKKSTLKRIAKGLGVPVNSIENFSEDTILHLITDMPEEKTLSYPHTTIDCLLEESFKAIYYREQSKIASEQLNHLLKTTIYANKNIIIGFLFCFIPLG